MGSRLARVAELLGVSKRDLSAEQVRSILNLNSGSHLPVTETDKRALSAVHGAVRILSGTVGSMPVHAYDATTGEKVNSWLDRPGGANGMFTPSDMWTYMVRCMLLEGNFYAVWRRGRLYPITPDRVKAWPVPSADGLTIEDVIYEVRPINVRVSSSLKQLWYTVNTDPGKVAIFGRDELVHVPYLDFDGVRGYSPLQVCDPAFKLAAHYERQATSIAASQGKLGGYLKTERDLSNKPNHIAMVRQRWNDMIRRSEEGDVAILDHGFDFESLQLSPQEAQLIESRKFAVTDVSRVYGVPLYKLASHDGYTAGSGLETTNKSFLVDTVEPLLTTVEGRLTQWLPSPLVARFDRTLLTRAEDKVRWQAYSIARTIGAMSVDEIRVAEGLQALGTAQSADPMYVTPSPAANAAGGNPGAHGGGSDAEQ